MAAFFRKKSSEAQNLAVSSIGLLAELLCSLNVALQSLPFYIVRHESLPSSLVQVAQDGTAKGNLQSQVFDLRR